MISKILGSFKDTAGEGRSGIFWLLLAVMIFHLIFGGTAATPTFKFTVGFTLSLILLMGAVAAGALSKLWNDSKLLTASLLALWFVPLVQIIPLPPELWHALPGRQLENEILDYIGKGDIWRPITVDIGATQFTLLALVPPTAVFLAALVASDRQRNLLFKVVLAIATIAAFIAFFQFASTGLAFSFYKTAHAGFGIGFFTNRNHQAVFIAIAMLLAAALVIRDVRSAQARLAALSLISILAFTASLAAFSRAGMTFFVLGFVCILFAALGGRRLDWRVAVGAFVGLGGVAAIIANSNQFGRFLERLETAADDQRFEYVANSLPIIADYFPVGSGIGTFVPIYQKYEEIDRLVPNYANHLHNDYLEILLESGGFGLLALIIGLITIGGLIFRHLRQRSSTNLLEAAAGVGTLFLLVHSLIDYPLRTPALACLFALLIVQMQSRAPRKAISRRGHAIGVSRAEP